MFELDSDSYRIACPPIGRVETAADAVRLFSPALAGEDRERLLAAHLDADGAVIRVDAQAGQHDLLVVRTAELVREACLCRTRRLLLAHNHPSGDPTPSRADRLTTRHLAGLLQLLDIELVDHLIFARGGVASFRALGLL